MYRYIMIYIKVKCGIIVVVVVFFFFFFVILLFSPLKHLEPSKNLSDTTHHTPGVSAIARARGATTNSINPICAAVFAGGKYPLVNVYITMERSTIL